MVFNMTFFVKGGGVGVLESALVENIQIMPRNMHRIDFVAM